MAGKRRRGRPLGSDGVNTREEILRVARQVFSELGYERTTFQEIATRAGVTRPAVNHYFHDKAALYRALFDSVRDSVVGGTGVDQATTRETLPGRLSAFLEAAVRGSTGEQVEQVRGFVRQALGAAVRSGEVRDDLDIPAVTEMLIAVLWGMVLYAGFVGTNDQLEEVVEQW